MSFACQRYPSLQNTQNPMSNPFSSSQNNSISFPSILPTPFQILIAHLFHFTSYLMALHLNLLFLLFSSFLLFWLLTNSKNLPGTHKYPTISLLVLYPFASCLSMCLFLLFDNIGERNPAIVNACFASSLSALMIFLLVQFKKCSVHQISETEVSVNKKTLQEQKDEALAVAEEQELLGTTLSHESRNVLNCLINSLNFLEIDMGNATNRAKEDLLGAKYCCETLLNYFNNYLENRKSVKIQQKSMFSLSEVIQKVQGMTKSAIEFKKLEAHFIIEENTPEKIVMNESSLTQILLNLIYNAIKFTDKGSIQVRLGWKSTTEQLLNSQYSAPALLSRNISCGNESFEGLTERSTGSSPDFGFRGNFSSLPNLSSDLSKGKLFIQVTDTGCGMTSLETNNLFKPYSQQNADPLKRKQGSGLGLWLTKTLVEKLGGQIKVESQVGEGSAFVILLECQGKTENEKSLRRKEFSTRSINSSFIEQSMSQFGLVLSNDAMESLVLQTFLKNMGITNVQQMTHLEDLWKYLDSHIEDEAIVVLDEKHITGVNGLYQWNKNLLNKKTIVTVEESVNAVKTHCLIEGHKRLEKPVKWDDFKKIVAH